MNSVRERDFGGLEQLTIAFLAASIIFSFTAWIIGFALMAFSKYWTVREKLLAVIIPLALAAVMFAVSEAFFSGVQGWIRIPLMVTLGLLAPASSAVWLTTRGSKPREELQFAA
jgi:hypothetical protein